MHHANEIAFAKLTPQAQAIIDRLCDAFEQQRRSADDSSIDDFLVRAPDELRSQLLGELLAIDVEYRRRSGEQPKLSDYQQTYPAIQASWFDQLAADTSAGFETEFDDRDESAATAGQVIGDYEICRLLGRGGMGEVYLAKHRVMDREVAIKLLTRELLRSHGSVRRFHREVKTAAKLTHPNMVTAYDAGEFEGRHYLVMEYVAGSDLATLVKRRGPFPIATALDYVIQAARGLAYAHAQGIVHRDVKPSNLLLDAGGTVKVTDLGLARTDHAVAASGDSELTTPNTLIGTMAFMAPEQSCDAGQADHRADIYSLGCTLYYLQVGRPPFKAESAVSTILAHQHDAIPPLTANHSVPGAVSDAYEKMMAKQPGDRFQSMDDAIDALCDGIASAPIAEHSNTRRATATDTTTPRWNRRTAIAVASVSVVSLAAGAIALINPDNGGEPRTANDEPPPKTTAADPPALLESPFGESLARQHQIAWAKHLGVSSGESTIRNTLGMQLVLIPPGRYRKGTDDAQIERLLKLDDSDDYEFEIRSESPLLSVALDRPFWFGQTEVTVAQFRRFADTERYRTVAEEGEDGGWGIQNGQWLMRPGYSWKQQGERTVSDDLPASNICWHDAVAFCAWLSETETLHEGQPVRYRLPSELEWEYACRSGTQTPWYWGDDANRIDDYVWHAGNADGCAQSVGKKAANAFGLRDMLGNEMEWCRDELPDQMRVQRGGSFFYLAHRNRCASRRIEVSTSPSHGGFRVMREAYASFETASSLR